MVQIRTGTLISVCVEDLEPEEPFRGEVHGTEPEIDLSDGVAILNWLFLGGPEPGCLDAADANDSGDIDLTDAVYLFDHLFVSGASLPVPSGDTCGEDPTGDAPDGTGDLGCLSPPEYCAP